MSRKFKDFYRKPYRGFESLPLRQPVWTAEKLPNIASKNARNCGHSAIHTLKPDQRNRIAKRSRSGSDPFSLDSRNAVRFDEDHGRTQCDHKSTIQRTR